MRIHRYRPRVWAAAGFMVLAGLASTTLIPHAGAADGRAATARARSSPTRSTSAST
jgi:hypothetical protein